MAGVVKEHLGEEVAEGEDQAVVLVVLVIVVVVGVVDVYDVFLLLEDCKKVRWPLG